LIPEVGLKARLDREVYLSMTESLENLGVELCGKRRESDHYYNSKYRDFRTTDEALRVREYPDNNGATSVFLACKGPKLDNRSIGKGMKYV